MRVADLLALLEDPSVKKKIVEIVEEDECRRHDEAQDILDSIMDDEMCYGSGNDTGG